VRRNGVALPRVEELFGIREVVACYVDGGTERCEGVRLAWGPVESRGNGSWEVKVVGFPLKAVLRKGVWVPVKN
jgi:hypothetical protein